MQKHELAKYFSVSCATIYRWDKEGKIPKPIIKSCNMSLYDVNACEVALVFRPPPHQLNTFF